MQKVRDSIDPYGLIILDNSMPYLTGVECARELRAMQQQDKLPAATKILLISGDIFSRRSTKENLALFD
jgi:CheY-like chemotaxis protein